MLGGPVQQRLQISLVAVHGPAEQPLALVIENVGEMCLLAGVQPNPDIHLPGYAGRVIRAWQPGVQYGGLAPRKKMPAERTDRLPGPVSEALTPQSRGRE